MAWTPEFTRDLFLKVQASPRKEALLVALRSAWDEVEAAESLRDMPSLGTMPSGRPAFYVAGCILLCLIDRDNKKCTFFDTSI